MISVVIPAYQAEQFIAHTVLSAKTQSIRPSEIIVVDDGSQDCTAQLAEESGATVIQQKNGGVASARNRGMKAARYEWIALLDSDDLWEPRKLEMQLAAASQFPEAAFVSCNHSFFDQHGEYSQTYLDRLGKDYFKAGRSEVAPGLAMFQRVNFTGLDWIVPSPSGLFLHKRVIDKIGYFDENLNGVDDTEFYLRAMAKFPFLFLEQPLVRYRQTEAGLARNHLLCLHSFLKTIDRIAANPQSYPDGVYESAMEVRANRLYQYGRYLCRAHRFSEARNILRESWKAKRNLKTLLAIFAAHARIRF